MFKRAILEKTNLDKSAILIKKNENKVSNVMRDDLRLLVTTKTRRDIDWDPEVLEATDIWYTELMIHGVRWLRYVLSPLVEEIQEVAMADPDFFPKPFVMHKIVLFEVICKEFKKPHSSEKDYPTLEIVS